MLFDQHGQPLTKPMVGMTTVDHFGHKLDLAIDEALARIGATSGPIPAQATPAGS